MEQRLLLEPSNSVQSAKQYYVAPERYGLARTHNRALRPRAASRNLISKSTSESFRYIFEVEGSISGGLVMNDEENFAHA